MMSDEQKRIEWIDIAKGIGMILVVYGHTSIPKYISNWIYSFHMPMFFIIAGMLFTPKGTDFYLFLKHKFKGLVIPYLFFLMWDIAYRFYWEINIPINIFTEGKIDFAYWFLQVLFSCSIINWVLIKYLDKWTYALVLFIFSIIGYYLSCKNMHFPYRLEVVFLASVHYGMGFLLKKHLKNRNANTIITSFVLVMTFVIAEFIPRLDMNYNHYGSYLPNILTAWIGSISIFMTSKLISRINKRNFAMLKSTLTWIGKNSIVIMGLSIPVNMSIKHLMGSLFLPSSVAFAFQHIFLWLFLYMLSFLLNRDSRELAETNLTI